MGGPVYPPSPSTFDIPDLESSSSSSLFIFTLTLPFTLTVTFPSTPLWRELWPQMTSRCCGGDSLPLRAHMSHLLPFPLTLTLTLTHLAARPVLFHRFAIPASPPSCISSPCSRSAGERETLTRISGHRWSVGSLLFLASWAVLMGPIQYAQHLLSAPRLPFTAAYFGSIVLTLLFAVKVGRPPPACAIEASCPIPSYPNKLTAVMFPFTHRV